jgi:hypothetical protein
LSTAAHWVKKRITLTLEKLVPFSSGYGILSRGRSLLEHDFEDLDFEDLRNLVAEIETANQLLPNDSPYPKVCFVVSPTDEPSLPVHTFPARAASASASASRRQ